MLNKMIYHRNSLHRITFLLLGWFFLFEPVETIYSQTSEVTIIVREQETDIPIDSVFVSLEGINNDTTFYGYTDSTGSITFFGLPTKVAGHEVTLPETFSLSNPYPQPFLNQTNLELAVRKNQNVTIALYNMLGQKLASYNKSVFPGYYIANFSLFGLSSGVYIVKVQAGEFIGSRQIIKHASSTERGQIRISLNPIANPSMLNKEFRQFFYSEPLLFTLTLQKEGYTTQTETVTITDNATFIRALSLEIPQNLTLKIKRIWSDQFANSQFNSSDNAGREGAKRQQILMGARNNHNAYIKTEFEINSTNELIHRKLATRLARRITGTNVLILNGSGEIEKIDGQKVVASMWTELEDIEPAPHDYFVVIWIDMNENGQRDETEIYTISNWYVTMVYEIHYDGNLEILLPAALVGKVFGPAKVPRASAFALGFLQKNEPIDYGGLHAPSFISFDAIETELKKSLSYNVGVDFSALNSGTIRNYFFGATSNLADDVRNSDAFDRVITEVLEKNRATILMQYPDKNEHILSLPANLEFPDPDETPTIGELDRDLFYTFHGVSFKEASLAVKVRCMNGNLQLSELNMTGSLIDLYDFDYTPDLEKMVLGPIDRMAIIQAGYGTLGDGGGIFRTEVNLSSKLSKYVGYNFGECKQSPPTILNFKVDLLQINSSTCQFSGGILGSLYRFTFDYTDPDGDVFTGSVVHVSFSFLPLGSSGSYDVTGATITGDGYSGKISFLTCLKFGNNISVIESLSITDMGGKTSNTVSATIPRPPGGNLSDKIVSDDSATSLGIQK